ncbi:MAG TPA: lycopene cyclase domain-containing protein [Anaerolineales bacterium]|nr:lycopene cyclase domain-containing protein [Anaerolineales bacterium]
MTYSGFLLSFIFIPILILFLLTGRSAGRPFWTAVLIHVILALVYTTPWDNFLVATHVWFYNPKLVTGIVFGQVPIEEYSFFILQTILAGLWWHLTSKRFSESKDFRPAKAIRLIAFVATLILWMVFTFLFFYGNKHLTYLSITLFWALPAMLPQMLFGADILWHHRKLVSLAILVPVAYLSLTDLVALRATTWSISPAQTIGILFFGILPIEEIAFFFLTTILIVFGMTLLLSDESLPRLCAWRSKNFKGFPWLP